jgi:type III secretory pathway component EscU
VSEWVGTPWYLWWTKPLRFAIQAIVIFVLLAVFCLAGAVTLGVAMVVEAVTSPTQFGFLLGVAASAVVVATRRGNRRA